MQDIIECHLVQNPAAARYLILVSKRLLLIIRTYYHKNIKPDCSDDEIITRAMSNLGCTVHDPYWIYNDKTTVVLYTAKFLLDPEPKKIIKDANKSLIHHSIIKSALVNYKWKYSDIVQLLEPLMVFDGTLLPDAAGMPNQVTLPANNLAVIEFILANPAGVELAVISSARDILIHSYLSFEWECILSAVDYITDIRAWRAVTTMNYAVNLAKKKVYKEIIPILQQEAILKLAEGCASLRYSN